MAGIFTIAPVNSIAFTRQTQDLPNFDNTPYQDKSEIGKAVVSYRQKVAVNDTITVQMKTDYTSITATLYNVLTNASTSLPVTLKTTYTSYSFYEISKKFTIAGIYKIFIDATLTGYAPVHYVSEVIEVANSWDGVKIEFYNDDNTPYVDYSTGIHHLTRIFGAVKFSDIGGKDEFYDNQGTEERVYSENEAVYEIVCEKIPYYLVNQILFGARLDHFFINDCEYLVKEHSSEHFTGSYLYNLTLKLTKREVQGINTDGEGGTYTFEAATSGDDFTFANEVITVYSEYVTWDADITTGYSGSQTRSLALYQTLSSGDVVLQNKSITFTEGGSPGLQTFYLRIYPNCTYHFDVSI